MSPLALFICNGFASLDEHLHTFGGPLELAAFLNHAQQQAVDHRQGPLLVIAGAGSGKTRVIQYRVMNLVLNGVAPESILLLTFTRRAAREMIDRASRHHAQCARVQGGTFHSFGANLLRQYAQRLGINPRFSILDQSDAEEALHKCASQLGYYDQPRRFPQKSTLQKMISQATNRQIPLSEILVEDYPNFLEWGKELMELRKAYSRYKLDKGYFDYDDLLLFLKLALEEDSIRQEVGQKYQYLMLDEYQDTNGLQGEIVELLGRSHQNVMAVGDDAQSIYGFRGAKHENILAFPQIFPGCKIIKLEQNYRSSQQILDLGNGLLAGMSHKYDKHLTSAEGRQGETPRLLQFKEPAEEATWIVDRIIQYSHQGEPLGQMAILFRSGYLSFHLQTELAKRKIPFDVFGGKKFSDTAHVKDLLSYLKILENPWDELAWNRVLILYPGIGPKTAAKLVEAIQGTSEVRELWQALHQFKGVDKVKPDLLALAQSLVEIQEDEPSVEHCFQAMLKAYDPLFQLRYDNWMQRKKDFSALSQIAARYKSLSELLSDFALEPPEREVAEVDPQYKEEGRVCLSTVHSAKGLEWGNVFVIGMIEGLFPTAYALKTQAGIEEEQRLFYVAITRAKSRLFLTLTHYGFKGGVTQFNKPSRFLEEKGVKECLAEGEEAAEGAQHQGRKKIPQALDKEALLKKLDRLLN